MPTDAAPTALPSGYEAALPPAPTDGASTSESSEGDGQAPPSGNVTLQQLLDWIKEVLGKAFQGHTEADADGEKVVKRNHARALRLD